jgi:hypothetical protein
VDVTRRGRSLVTPFWVRLATETSLSAGWFLIAFPAVLYPLYLVLEALFGRGLAAATDFGGDFEASLVPFWATVLGYLTMMATYVARGTFHDLEALRPVLPGGEAAYANLREQLTQFDRRRLWIGGLIGFAFVCVSAELGIERWTRLVAGDWSLRAICIIAASSAAWVIFGRVTVYLIDSSRVYSRTGEKQVTVDLLDLAPLSPLTHHGLRIVLLVTILVTASAVVWIVAFKAAPVAWGWPMITTFNWLWAVVLAVAAFVLPVRGLRRQIRARKAEKLALLRDEIRHNEELMTGSGTESAEAGAKLPGLLAFKHEIESVHEWPFDAPTLTRFFLYVAIPIGSWIGGALVERLLGVALD